MPAELGVGDLAGNRRTELIAASMAFKIQSFSSAVTVECPVNVSFVNPGVPTVNAIGIAGT